MSEKHTKLPWRALDSANHRDLAGHVVIGRDGKMVADCNIFCPTDPNSCSDEACRANHLLIVRAVNAHDDLLAACKSLVEAIENPDKMCGGLITRARAAIAKAAPSPESEADDE